MIIKVSVSTGLVGSKVYEEFEIEDDATEDEIEKIARETMFNLINWSWEKK